MMASPFTYFRGAALGMALDLGAAPSSGLWVQRKRLDSSISKARSSDSLKAFAKLAETVDGRVRIKPDPPLVVPVQDLMPEMDRVALVSALESLLEGYRDTWSSDRRVLFDRFELVDLARKVVGVGSLGTRCWIALMRGRDDSDPLFLQVKEAQPSVLARVLPAASGVGQVPANQGERVVSGQRLMQASSDVFLGWQRVEGIDGRLRDFYVRQLRDMKGSAVVETMTSRAMRVYGELCGWTLARAHARSGDPIAIAAYLGDDDAVPAAMAEFAERYADRTELDHAALVAAVRNGRLAASEVA